VAGTDDLVRGYAEALFAVARAEGELEQVEGQLYAFAKLLETDDRVRDALIDPQLPVENKRGLIRDTLGERANPIVVNLLGFLVEQGRAREIDRVVGEMSAVAAEGALIDLLRHSDDRVRRSATNALLKLGTPNALKTVYEAVGDASPEVRMQAAAAISTKRDGRTSLTLIRAIEDEADADVQIAMIAALGRVATAEAVQKLLKLAEPDSRLFRKKPTNIRVAAVQALGEAKTPAAIQALKDLSADKEREVRDTASRALTHAR